MLAGLVLLRNILNINMVCAKHFGQSITCVALPMPDIRSVACAIWSRQRAISAGLDGSMAPSGTGPTASEAHSQRPEASGCQRTASRRAAQLGD
jgi:hypothetical protein